MFSSKILLLLLVLCGLVPRPTLAWTHGTCGEAQTATAAMSGLTSAQTNAYSTLICGMVADGDFGHLAGLWVATTSQANSLINLILPGTHNLVNHSTTFGTPGWIGNGTSAYLDTGLGSGGTQNSASLGLCVLNSRTTSITGYDFAANDNNVYQMIRPDNTAAGATQVEVNGQTPIHAQTNTNAQGGYGLVRSNSTQINLYYNGALSGNSPISTTSVANQAFAMLILAYNDGGGGTINNFSADTIGYAWMGDGSVNAVNIYNRLHTFINNASIGGTAC